MDTNSSDLARDLRYSRNVIRNIQISPLSHPQLAHLFDCPKAPEAFFVQGHDSAIDQLAQLPNMAVAIVGTRVPALESVRFTSNFVSELKTSKAAIVSGFARGIDFQAHLSAIQNGLFTVGILGAGLDISYPIHSRGFRQHFLESGGVLVSEFAPETPPYASHFLQRNRLIAAWSSILVVVQAREQSGALSTAGWAEKIFKPIYCVPSFPGDSRFAGNAKLIANNVAKPVFSARDISRDFPEFFFGPPATDKSEGDRSWGEKLIRTISTLTEEGMGLTLEGIHSFSQKHGILLQDIFEFLGNLEDLGQIQETKGRYQLTNQT